MQQFIIFMGGTGARCAEAFAYLGACGLLGTHETHVLLVDADLSNGNLTRAAQVLDAYQGLHNTLAEGRDAPDRLLGKPLPHRKWIVGMKDKADFRLSQLAGDDLPAKRAMSALYSASEMERPITTVGFFAHPNVGAAVMRAVLLKEADSEQEHHPSEYGKFRRQIRTALSAGEARVMLVGSVFGGTGASALPALAKDIAGLAGDTPELKQRLRIGAVLMLPYFHIQVPVRTDGQIDSAAFPLAAKTAVQYYRDEAGQFFERGYLLGGAAGTTVENMGAGGGRQENPPMFVEWEAAMAAAHFFDARDFSGTINHFKWMTFTEDGKMQLRWGDFSLLDAQASLSQMVTFAAFYLQYYLPEIAALRTGRKAPPGWYTNYVEAFDHTVSGRTAIDQLAAFLRGFLQWFAGALVEDEGMEQDILSGSLLTALVEGQLSLDDAGRILHTDGKPIRKHRILTAINQGSGAPFTFQTFIHHLFEVCG